MIDITGSFYLNLFRPFSGILLLHKDVVVIDDESRSGRDMMWATPASFEERCNSDGSECSHFLVFFG